MIRVAAWAVQLFPIGLVLYNSLLALFGWRTPPRAPRSRRDRPVRIVVPAHDEEAVIPALLADLADQDYEGPIEVVVVADRCQDETVAAVVPPARVVERVDGVGGKGAALGWYLDRDPLAPGSVLIVIDADNRVPPDLASRLVDEIESGRPIAQAYLDVSNPDASLLATANALSYWAGNRMVQLARHNLGWPCDLGGTGMAFTAEALTACGGFGAELTEDQGLTVRAARAGIFPAWVHDVRVRDEKPAGLAATVRQRARWQRGKRSVFRRERLALLGEAVARRSLALADLWLRLTQPGRSFQLLGLGVLAAAAATTRSRYLLPWPSLAAVVVVALALPVVFLVREGVAARYVVRYPVLVLLAALWLPVRVASTLVRSWQRTPHVGAGDVPG